MDGMFDLAALDRDLDAQRALDDEIGTLSARLNHQRPRKAQKPAAPFWMLPGGLELDSVWYDPLDREFVVSFARGPTYRFPDKHVRKHADVLATEVDDHRHGVVVVFGDLSTTDFAGDLVLFHCEPSYRRSLDRTGYREPRGTDIGSNIRRARIAQGRTASQVARELGMAPSNYSRLESGAHRPRVDLLVQLSAALRVPLSRLVRIDRKTRSNDKRSDSRRQRE